MTVIGQPCAPVFQAFPGLGACLYLPGRSSDSFLRHPRMLLPYFSRTKVGIPDFQSEFSFLRVLIRPRRGRRNSPDHPGFPGFSEFTRVDRSSAESTHQHRIFLLRYRANACGEFGQPYRPTPPHGGHREQQDEDHRAPAVPGPLEPAGPQRHGGQAEPREPEPPSPLGPADHHARWAARARRCTASVSPWSIRYSPSAYSRSSLSEMSYRTRP